MKILYNIYVIISLMMIISSCNQTTTPEQTAIKMTKEELTHTIGYTWFNVYINDYAPNDSLTHIIDSLFNRNKHRLIFFLEPECTCEELVKDPAYLVNILEHSNITEDNYEFWGMGSTKTDHPYKDLINLNELPHVALMSSNNYVYSILDSFYKYQVYKKWNLENALIDALEKNQ